MKKPLHPSLRRAAPLARPVAWLCVYAVELPLSGLPEREAREHIHRGTVSVHTAHAIAASEEEAAEILGASLTAGGLWYDPRALRGALVRTTAYVASCAAAGYPTQRLITGGTGRVINMSGEEWRAYVAANTDASPAPGCDDGDPLRVVPMALYRPAENGPGAYTLRRDHAYTLRMPQVSIDPVAVYGYWECKDGTEGGGLWFEREANGGLTLYDYDGAAELPRRVVETLEYLGVGVEG